RFQQHGIEAGRLDDRRTDQRRSGQVELESDDVDSREQRQCDRRVKALPGSADKVAGSLATLKTERRRGADVGNPEVDDRGSIGGPTTTADDGQAEAGAGNHADDVVEDLGDK